jgi:hypothetical protein
MLLQVLLQWQSPSIELFCKGLQNKILLQWLILPDSIAIIECTLSSPFLAVVIHGFENIKPSASSDGPEPAAAVAFSAAAARARDDSVAPDASGNDGVEAAPSGRGGCGVSVSFDGISFDGFKGIGFDCSSTTGGSG